MVLMLGFFIHNEYTRHRMALLNELSLLAAYNGQVIEQSLQHSMQISDFTEVQRILDTVGENENFRLISLLDTSSKVIFAPNGVGIGVQLDNRDPSCQPCHKLSPNERRNGVVVTGENGQRLFRSMQPIVNNQTCSECHDPRQRLIGVLLTDISVAPFEATFLTDLRENLIWGISIILVSAIIANLVMDRLVVSRLNRVACALADFGGGKRDMRLEPGSHDELGQLEVVFNEMGQRMQTEETKNQALTEDLHRQTINQHELLKRLITAQEDERKRVARELHDELGQSLSGLALHSEVIERFIYSNPERAREQLLLTRELIGKTSEQMYELILALRPSVLDDLGLSDALRSHAERVLKGSGITFRMDSSGLIKRLPATIETALYRVFQEALSNIIKHSHGNQVEIILARHDGFFEGEIADNGQGFNLESVESATDNLHGFGLLGMQERLAQCGGSMDIISRVGEGTSIRFHIPLRKVIDE